MISWRRYLRRGHFELGSGLDGRFSERLLSITEIVEKKIIRRRENKSITEGRRGVGQRPSIMCIMYIFVYTTSRCFQLIALSYTTSPLECLSVRKLYNHNLFL